MIFANHLRFFFSFQLTIKLLSNSQLSFPRWCISIQICLLRTPLFDIEELPEGRVHEFDALLFTEQIHHTKVNDVGFKPLTCPEIQAESCCHLDLFRTPLLTRTQLHLPSSLCPTSQPSYQSCYCTLCGSLDEIVWWWQNTMDSKTIFSFDGAAFYAPRRLCY
jgi:hypothetical protein